VHYRHVGQVQVTVAPLTLHTLPAGHSDEAHMHESGLSPPHGLSAQEDWIAIPLDCCTQTCPGMHIDAPQGTAAQAEVLTLQTSLMQVASADLVPNAHS
jgi:hypothetical protein